MRRLIFSTILSATLVFAQMGSFADRGPRGSRGKQVDALKAALELNDAQVEELLATRTGLRDQLKPLMEQMRNIRTQLKDSVENPAVSDAEVGALVRHQDAIRAQIKQANDTAKETAIAKINGWGRAAQLEALQDAANKRAAVGQAMRLGLLERPEGAQRMQDQMGPGGRNPMMGGPGPGPRP